MNINWYNFPKPLLISLFVVALPIIALLFISSIVMANLIRTPEIYTLGPITISINQPTSEVK